MRRLPASTGAFLAIALGLAAALALLGWRHWAENQSPIVREINELVANFQAQVQVDGGPGTGAHRSGRRAWPVAFLAGAAATLVGVRLHALRQKRSRSSSS